MHLLPGLTAIALAAAAVVVRPRSEREPSRPGAPSLRFQRVFESGPVLALGAAAIMATLVVAGASLSRQGLADYYGSRAQSELAVHPAAAIVDANRSLDIDSDAVATYYIKAAALARFDQAAAAAATLRQALAHEPESFVTWALLGDVAVRERRLSMAQRDYARAHRLNPRDATLTELSRDPGSALR